ncbi:penicillin-binding protein [Listeria grandensis FSL F6-0971]|uniref:Penicillin-binding protein n=1 Tax=Listeria grandensis FSL F6-0971 TaxID=1265819 RepID=W7BU10_9LIST|nr:serine hydrolase domain-containing protein [Listeria grandensis]EUJ23778.1 penicillin-binding protein [Listeria grandensis FSL F6-0971]
MHVSRAEKARVKRKKRRLGVLLAVMACFLFGGVGSAYLFVQAHSKVTANEMSMNDESTATVKANIVIDPNASLKTKVDLVLKKHQFNGAAYVVKDNKVIINQGYGLANKTTGEANTSQSLFFIGSMEKAVVATAIMQLQEKGMLSVEDPIAKYFPTFPNGESIKIKNFLGHTSGVEGRKKGNQKITSQQVLEEVEAAGIKRSPGTWDYQDDNYAVMGRLVEVLTHKSLASYLAQYVFAPAGMKSTAIGDSFFTHPNESVSYKVKDGMLMKTSFVQDTSQLFGAGNMYMPPKDIYLFDKALTSGKLVNQASMRSMLHAGAGNYGYGFYTRPNFYISRGVLYNYETINSFSKDRRDAVIVFSNIRMEKDSGALVKEIYSVMQ